MENYPLERRLAARKEPPQLCPEKCSISPGILPSIPNPSKSLTRKVRQHLSKPISYPSITAKENVQLLFPSELKFSIIPLLIQDKTSDISNSHMVHVYYIVCQM